MDFQGLYSKYKKTIVQFFKFNLIGIANFLVDLAVFTLMYEVLGVDSILSKAVSYSCGIVNSFFWNRKWTFKKRHKFVSVAFLKFIGVNLVSLGVSLFALYVFETLFMLNTWIAYLLSTIFSFTVNFAGNKLIVFKETK